MEKCWFVLKQSHYPPPDLPENGIGIANGAICLGHIIPDSKNLDGVINRSEDGIKFTPAAWKLEGAANASAPIGGAVTVTAEQHTKLAFERTEKDHKEFGTLDRYIIQVNRKFIGGILEDKEVATHIERTKGVKLLGIGGQWSVYMITGITVARGAKGESAESRKFEANTSTDVNVTDAASGGLAANFASNKSTSMLAQKSSDFVWAVRLVKIWKDATKKDWDFRTVSKGATFSLDDEKQWKDEIQQTLSQELSEVEYQTLDLPDEEGMIVF
ncbi:hypothetical protein K469DRAFT_804532 [Zopfia rhizophila CBS 207.26]|uniref:MACPF domain-containing protein n=1 Tax=Zopfia rhizophila CBS 207.26 TaxID=1314779 RepID=A0A6A6ELY2_9PEZI|nr:hypothetical protein K469DRAFT_804532 [Zopfia rhizophila CBS 207.26]